MDKILKNFGFGCMRLPMIKDEVDHEQFAQMVDIFIEQGFNYFDTAHGYISGKSETALKKGLTSRYPRDTYILTNKLTKSYFNTESDVRPFFQSQLEACGVDYFDFYLMHAQTSDNFPLFKKAKAYETAFELKKEGKIRHVGLSFHDKASVLDMILTEYPQIEVVQIQFNYVDFEDPAIESRKCYEVARKHGKPVIVMEPVKGGKLVNLPQEALHFLTDLNGSSPASYAIRFAASYEGVFMVLSGMSTLDQMNDNLSTMKDFIPLNQGEKDAIAHVVQYFKSLNMIACTDCRYCVDGCPEKILIPDLFATQNAKKAFNDWNSDFYYNVLTKENGKASACIECRACEEVCPQHLPIPDLLKDVAKTFEH